MRLFNYVVEAHLHARRPWSHFKVHRHRENRWYGAVLYRHLVWGKLSIIFGQPHLVPITVCSHCNEEIARVGGDYLDWCAGCQCLEGPTEEITTEEFERRHG